MEPYRVYGALTYTYISWVIFHMYNVHIIAIKDSESGTDDRMSPMLVSTRVMKST